MSVTMHNISQEEPVHFRVTNFAPSPIPELSRPGWLVLSVAYINKAGGTPGGHFEIPPEWYRPHLDAINEAIESQSVYWVDWDYSKVPNFPPRFENNTVVRLLQAIGDRQIVSPETEE